MHLPISEAGRTRRLLHDEGAAALEDGLQHLSGGVKGVSDYS